MDLKYIRLKNCPDCGSRTVTDSIRGSHVNGQDREVRVFQCGYEMEWSPNFERIEIRYACPNSKEEVERRNKNKAIRDEIEALLEQADLKDFQRACILSYFEG